MLCLKVPLRKAEAVKKELIKRALFDKEHLVTKDKEFVYFPVKKRFSTKYPLITKPNGKRKVSSNLKKALATKLEKKELELVKRSMDVIGSIAILEIPSELEKNEKIIAEEVLNNNKRIRTVLKKGRHDGIFRTQKLEYLAGENTKEAVCKENNVLLKMNVEKVYFSPRLSSERKRICGLIKEPEEVLVMFSGCAPYVCVIAKNTPAKKVVGIEINPEGHKYALQNIVLNKLYNAEVLLGDVKQVVPKLGKKYDRIIMPLPKSASDYLDVALGASKEGGVIHFYDFQKEGEFDKSVEKIMKACEASGRKCKILGITRCGQSAPREFRICVDFMVE